jgi:hypothetical protein
MNDEAPAITRPMSTSAIPGREVLPLPACASPRHVCGHGGISYSLACEKNEREEGTSLIAPRQSGEKRMAGADDGRQACVKGAFYECS